MFDLLISILITAGAGVFCAMSIAANYKPKRKKPIITNVTMSPEVAAKLRAKECSAFVPVSAAELIWAEAKACGEFEEAGE